MSESERMMLIEAAEDCERLARFLDNVDCTCRDDPDSTCWFHQTDEGKARVVARVLDRERWTNLAEQLRASRSSGGATSEEDAAILAEAAEVLEREARSEPMLTVASREEMVAAIRRASRRLGVSGSATADGLTPHNEMDLGEARELLREWIDGTDWDAARSDEEGQRANAVHRVLQELDARGSAPSEEATKRLGHIATLKQDWDSYGARAIDTRAIEAARGLLKLLPGFIPVPTSSGGVQVERTAHGFHVAIEIEADGSIAENDGAYAVNEGLKPAGFGDTQKASER